MYGRKEFKIKDLGVEGTSWWTPPKETTFDVDKAVKSLQDVVKQLALTVERVKL